MRETAGSLENAKNQHTFELLMRVSQLVVDRTVQQYPPTIIPTPTDNGESRPRICIVYKASTQRLDVSRDLFIEL